MRNEILELNNLNKKQIKINSLFLGRLDYTTNVGIIENWCNFSEKVTLCHGMRLSWQDQMLNDLLIEFNLLFRFRFWPYGIRTSYYFVAHFNMKKLSLHVCNCLIEMPLPNISICETQVWKIVWRSKFPEKSGLIHQNSPTKSDSVTNYN